MIIAFAATYGLTYLMLVYAKRRGLLDRPGERSSHQKIMPRGGGVSVVIVFLLTLLTLYYLDIFYVKDKLIVASIILGSGIVAITGLWDDHLHIPARWRVLLHCLAALLALLLLPKLPELQLFSIKVNSEIILSIIFTFGLIWILNLYNFMDGIDGIASIEAITVSSAAAVIMILHGENDLTQLLLVLSVCVAAFLIWNWPPAKIFMGDACSGFLGFTLGLMAIITSNTNAINLWSWLILLAIFIVDATVTLFRRTFNREKWYKAHRSHAYQILSRRYNSHRRVTVSVLVINLIWLFPLAYFATVYEYWAPALSMVAIAPLIIIAFNVGAGIKNN